MRAVVHHRFGEPGDVLTVEDVPEPRPGPGEVVVRTTLAPVHNHNLWTIRGIYGVTPALPARTGTEAVGVVTAVGAGVEHLSVGQRVATGDTSGVWAEYFLARPGDLLPIDPGVPDEVAAQLVSMPFSALSLLDSLQRGTLTAGDWIVQNAANGTVGRLLAQLAAAKGLRVAGLVRRAAAVGELAAQGIDHVVSTDAQDWRQALTGVTGGGRLAVGIDSVGGTASGDLASVLGEGGTLVVFGGMDSPVLQIPAGSVMFKNLTVRGFWSGQHRARMDPARRDALFGELVDLVHRGVLTLPVEATHSLEDVRTAVEANARPGRAGKLLLRP